MIKKIVTIGAIVLLSACAEMQSSEQQVESKPSAKQQVKSKPVATNSVAATDARAAIAAAEKARKSASKVSYEWRHTAKMIKQAKSAAKKKNYQKAIELANKAKKQGEDALAQYHAQKGAGMNN